MFRKISTKLGHKFRLTILDNESLRQTRVFIVSRLGVIILLFLSIFALVGGTMAIFMYTPVRQIIPGYTNPALVQEVDTLRSRVATLTKMVDDYESYLNSISAIAGVGPGLPGRKNQGSQPLQQTPEHSGQTEGAAPSSSSGVAEVTSNESIVDQPNTPLSAIAFFRPARGVVKRKFDQVGKNPGIDILTPREEIVKSVADGFVVFSGYSAENGSSIAVDNGSGLITVFKNLEQLYRREGEFVKGGEALGTAGTRGEKLGGSGLHLELWSKGKAIDPEKFIQFN